MNELNKINTYLISWFQADELVNTVTTLTDDLIDTNKETIYPLVNLEYINTDVLEDVVLVLYRIKCMDQEDVYTTPTDSKLLINTNHQDIMNETFNVCQSFINSFRQYNDDNIEIQNKTVLTPIKFEKLNGLSGHSFDIVLSIPNIGTSCP
jgi:predicted nucleic-acid-binding protein